MELKQMAESRTAVDFALEVLVLEEFLERLSPRCTIALSMGEMEIDEHQYSREHVHGLH